MTKRAEAPIGAPCWIDLMTSDTAGARQFYGSLFGWEAQEPNPEYGGYFSFLRDGGEIAGCMTTPAEVPGPDVWSVYLAVEDARKSAAAAAARGATVVAEAMDVGDLGTMAVLVDPGGAGFGLWQRKEHRGLASVYAEGAPSWFELHTRNYEPALEFYREVFGWTTQAVSDTPEFRYTVLMDGEEQLAGVMDASSFLPAGAPAKWSIYFGVGDADVALAKAAELGGAVVLEAEDTPYGRLATAADPTGAEFKLVAPNDQMPAR
ncbi:VOC family protein [Tomitella biformata]|uniref:VOC family protein n=1 Tax=Tomitella biformata TaxID=630403 RepID=UPI000462EAB8|nr:VOC family protein [Tomitella biformata]